jgi:hypothetical protein
MNATSNTTIATRISQAIAISTPLVNSLRLPMIYPSAYSGPRECLNVRHDQALRHASLEMLEYCGFCSRRDRVAFPLEGGGGLRRLCEDYIGPQSDQPFASGSNQSALPAAKR